AHLLEFDSTFGPLRWDVSHDDGGFTVGGHRIPVTGLRDPATLGWGELSVDLVIEATGKLRGRDDAAAHLKAGAKRVLISAPGKDLRRARSGAVNIIPTSTGAARAIGLVLPQVAGRLNGVALRVPVENGSLSDLTCQLAMPVTAAEVNEVFLAASRERLDGI